MSLKEAQKSFIQMSVMDGIPNVAVVDLVVVAQSLLWAQQAAAEASRFAQRAFQCGGSLTAQSRIFSDVPCLIFLNSTFHTVPLHS